MKRKVKQLLFGGPDHLPISGELGLLALRVGAGVTMAFGHGLGKIPPGDHVENVSGLGLPMPELFAWASGIAEFVCALLVVVGLFTRPAALILAINMAVAFSLAHGGRAFADGEMAFLYLLIAVTFMLTGAGRLSIDRMLRPGS